MRPALRVLVALGAWAVLLGAVAALMAAVLVPRLWGATPYTVLSGSMRPELQPGDLVVTRPVDFGDIEMGAVVTYQLRSGEPRTVTHRVVGRSVGGDGEPVLVTRGDANDGPDPETVREAQVRGEVWYVVPRLGHVGAWATPEQRRLVARVVAGGLFCYAGWMLVAARRRRLRDEPAPRHRAAVEPGAAEPPDAGLALVVGGDDE